MLSLLLLLHKKSYDVDSTPRQESECLFHEKKYVEGRKLHSIAMQIYSEMIGNVMIDARSTGKYYHCK